jgi:monothiol glutaredoxin
MCTGISLGTGAVGPRGRAIIPEAGRGARGDNVDVMSDAPQPTVRPVTAPELQALLADGAPLVLVDVRTVEERDLARIDGARLLDQALFDELLALPRDTRLVFHCHHGIRSANAAEHFRRQGFTNLSNLVGGIEAWSTLVDPSVPRY